MSSLTGYRKIDSWVLCTRVLSFLRSKGGLADKLPEVPLVVGWGADTAEELSFSKNGAGSMSRL